MQGWETDRSNPAQGPAVDKGASFSVRNCWEEGEWDEDLGELCTREEWVDGTSDGVQFLSGSVLRPVTHSERLDDGLSSQTVGLKR